MTTFDYKYIINEIGEKKVNFSRKQKISIIFSMWLFFLWIVSMPFIMRMDFKGSLSNCIWTSCFGIALVMAIYFLIFMDRYKIRKFANSEDCERIKSIKRATYIALVYEDIVAFYLLTFATLIVDVEDQILGKFGWFGLISVLTVAAIAFTVAISTMKIYNLSKAFRRQEENSAICGKTVL